MGSGGLAPLAQWFEAALESRKHPKQEIPPDLREGGVGKTPFEILPQATYSSNFPFIIFGKYVLYTLEFANLSSSSTVLGDTDRYILRQ